MAPCPSKGTWVQYLSVCLARWGFYPEQFQVLFLLRTGRFHWQPRREEEQAPAHAAGHTCPVCPGASWGRHSVSPAHQHPTCTYLWQPSPGHCPSASGVTAPPAGSSSFPLYYFVDCLHHSAVEKFKCFVTFHWEDTTKLKCLDRGSI